MWRVPDPLSRRLAEKRIEIMLHRDGALENADQLTVGEGPRPSRFFQQERGHASSVRSGRAGAEEVRETVPFVVIAEECCIDTIGSGDLRLQPNDWIR